jgi:hypothetical protein
MVVQTGLPPWGGRVEVSPSSGDTETQFTLSTSFWSLFPEQGPLTYTFAMRPVDVTPLSDNDIEGFSPITPPQRSAVLTVTMPAGDWTVACIAEDTSGVFSLVTTTVHVDLPADPVAAAFDLVGNSTLALTLGIGSRFHTGYCVSTGSRSRRRCFQRATELGLRKCGIELCAAHRYGGEGREGGRQRTDGFGTGVSTDRRAARERILLGLGQLLNLSAPNDPLRLDQFSSSGTQQRLHYVNSADV